MDIFSYLLGKKSSGGGGGGGGADLDWQAIGFSKRPEGIDDGYEYAKYIQENWETIKSNKFQGDRKLKFFPVVDMSTLPTNHLQFMFQGCASLIAIALFDISRFTTMYNMFSGCNSLHDVPLFDTKNVTNMGNAFQYCYPLENIPLFNTQNVITFASTFSDCTELKNVPLFNTNKVTYFGNMFERCQKLTDQSLDNILQMCINATSYTGTKTLKTLGIYNTTAYPVSRIEALPHYQDFVNAGWTIGY